jgi:hypothetical protein
MRRLCVLTVLLLCGCGQQGASDGDGAVSSGHNQQASAPSGGAAASLVPPFPGSTPVEVPNFGAPGTDSRSGNTIAMETSADPEQVATFYREHFRGAGIPVRADTANAQGGLISVARDGERGAMITISRIGDRTRIAVIMGPR